MLSKLSPTLSVPLVELSLVVAAVIPVVSAFALRTSLVVHSLVGIPIREGFFSIAVLKTALELSPIGAGLMVVNSSAFLSPLDPFALVVVSVGTFPNPLPVFFSFLPVSSVFLAVVPLELPFPFSQPIHELADVETVISDLHSSVLLVVPEGPFKDEILADKDPFSLFDGVELSEVDSVVIGDDLKAFCF